MADHDLISTAPPVESSALAANTSIGVCVKQEWSNWQSSPKVWKTSLRRFVYGRKRTASLWVTDYGVTRAIYFTASLRIARRIDCLFSLIWTNCIANQNISRHSTSNSFSLPWKKAARCFIKHQTKLEIWGQYGCLCKLVLPFLCPRKKLYISSYLVIPYPRQTVSDQIYPFVPCLQYAKHAEDEFS